MALTQISTQGIKDGTITATDLATNVDFVDNQKLRLGNSQDLSIFHDGTESLIQHTGAGVLKIEGNGANNVFLRAKTAENSVTCIPDGGVSLFHNNIKKFETTTDGVKISGAEGVEAILTFEPDDGDNASDKFRFRASDSAGFFLENGSSKMIEKKILFYNEK